MKIIDLKAKILFTISLLFTLTNNSLEAQSRKRVNKNNPVKDNQSLLSRIFQGRTDRY